MTITIVLCRSVKPECVYVYICRMYRSVKPAGRLVGRPVQGSSLLRVKVQETWEQSFGLQGTEHRSTVADCQDVRGLFAGFLLLLFLLVSFGVATVILIILLLFCIIPVFLSCRWLGRPFLHQRRWLKLSCNCFLRAFSLDQLKVATVLSEKPIVCMYVCLERHRQTDSQRDLCMYICGNAPIGLNIFHS